MRLFILLFCLFFQSYFTQEQFFWYKKEEFKVEIDFLFDKKAVQLIWEIEKNPRESLVSLQKKWKKNEKFLIFLFRKNKIYFKPNAQGFTLELQGKGIYLSENYILLQPFFWVSPQSGWRLTWTPEVLEDSFWCSELALEEKNQKIYLILTLYFQEFRDRNDFRTMNFAQAFLRLFQEIILEVLQVL